MSPRTRLLVYWLVTVVAHTAIALVMCSDLFYYVNVGTSQRVFGLSTGFEAVFDDVKLYHHYASRAVRGAVPYRDYTVEYPILAFPFLWLPRKLASSLSGYRWAFGAEMMLADAVLVWLVARRVAAREGIGAVPRRLVWSVLCLAGLGPLLVSRFDLAPTAIAFAASLAWAAGRPILGGIGAGLGIFVKVFPGLVALPGLGQEAARLQRAFPRGTIALVATLAIGAWGWYALGGKRTSESLAYHQGRGLEIGSTYSGALIAAAKLNGTKLGHDYNHKSEELLTAWSASAARWAPLIQVAALLLVAWRSRRAALGEYPRLAGAAILAFIVAGKVLSPQYLLWLWPFVLTTEGSTGRWARPLYLACCLATFLVYPWSFPALVINFDTLAIAFLNARNLLLVALFALLLAGPLQVAKSEGGTSS